jgi:FemAB-related protein (PEP-CTERM system-associated)
MGSGIPARDYQLTESPDSILWDAYVSAHPRATLYHLSGWLQVVRKSYGHKVYSLAACERSGAGAGRITGVLPLVHIKHPLFGNRLVSMPFFDMGGILADSPEIGKTLLGHALSLARRVGASALELRHTDPIQLDGETSFRSRLNPDSPICRTWSQKVRMLLDLPDSPEALLKSFKSKLRSQINRPLKGGLQIKSGGVELVDEFYGVFLENMRDLGSPVHSRTLIKNAVLEFSERARVFVVYQNRTPLAASLALGFNGMLMNPWASALRRFSHLSPNMLLYWGMLEHATQNGYAKFDFGRSTLGEGTFRFKEQWGAKPSPLHWQYIGWNAAGSENGSELSRRFELAAAVWKRLPLVVTRVFGPAVRKYISL